MKVDGEDKNLSVWTLPPLNDVERPVFAEIQAIVQNVQRLLNIHRYSLAHPDAALYWASKMGFGSVVVSISLPTLLAFGVCHYLGYRNVAFALVDVGRAAIILMGGYQTCKICYSLWTIPERAPRALEDALHALFASIPEDQKNQLTDSLQSRAEAELDKLNLPRQQLRLWA